MCENVFSTVNFNYKYKRFDFCSTLASFTKPVGEYLEDILSSKINS